MNHKPRILFVTEISGLGGGETSLLNLLSTLKERGYEPTLACPTGLLFDRAIRSGINSIGLDFPPIKRGFGHFPYFSLITILKCLTLIIKNKIDIVHVESQRAFYYFCLPAWLTNTPCLITYHGYWRLTSGFSKLLLKYFCARIYPVSQNTMREIQIPGGLSPNKIRTIPLGVNKKFIDDLPRKESLRTELNLPVDRAIVIQVARFQKIKGQMILLEALARLVSLGIKEIPLIIFVGDLLDKSSLEDNDYKKNIEARARTAALVSHTLFLGERSDVHLLMKAADIVVIPSEYETFSMATIEAMVVGTPVIATSSGGPAEIIQNYRTGILIPPNDPQTLADAIYTLISNPELAQKLSIQGQVSSRLKYDPHARFDLLDKEYLDIYSSRIP